MTPCQHPHNTWAFDAAIELNVGAPYRRAVAACRAACAECPIRAECLRDHREQAGVIAGLTLEERATKPPAQKRASCGTSYGASAHYKRGESVCEACRIAGNASRTKARQARRAAKRDAA